MKGGLPTTPLPQGPRVAIIGAGYAGMAAAVTLLRADANIRISLFETATVAGGRARAVTYRGHCLDNGQHMLIGAYTRLLALMREVGVPDSHLLRLPMQMCLYPDFELKTPRLPAPLHLGWGLLTARGLSWADKFAAMRLSTLVQAPALPSALCNATVAKLLTHTRQTPRLVKTLWLPLCMAALNTPIESASASVFAHVMRDALFRSREHSDFLLPTVSLSALFPDPALAWAEARGAVIALGTRVRGIQRTASGLAVHANGQAGSSPEFAAVLCAVGPHQLEFLDGDAGRLLGQCRPSDYEPIYTIYLWYSSPVPLPTVMIGRQTGLVQWFFDRSRLGGPAGLVAAIVSASGPHESHPQQAVAQQAHRELEEIVGPLPTPMWSKVIAERFATFACTPGVQRPATETAMPGLFLAGDYIAGPYPGTLEGAVRSGEQAATAMLNYFRH